LVSGIFFWFLVSSAIFIRCKTPKTRQGGIQLTKDIRIGALISGGGSNLQAVIDACRHGKINGRLVFVGSDNSEANGLARARRENIPTFVVDYKSIIRKNRADPEKMQLPDDFDFKDMLKKQTLFDDGDDPVRVKLFLESRALAEARLLRAMAPYPFDLIILAGFIRNLSPYFIDRVNLEPRRPRIMNIHPSLLPAFAGVDGYGDTFRYGCKVGGCTVHFVDYGEDTGPIIGQRAFQIQPQDTIDSIRKKGLALEWDLYPACIQLFAQGRIEVVRKDFDLGKGKKALRRIVVIEN
jgi:phosphoribosylglycinamide formyltransferase-1